MSKNKGFSGTSANRYSSALYELAEESSVLSQIEKNAISILNLIEKSEAEIKQYRLNQNKSSQVYNIPVVVHVLHKGEAVGTGTNISDAQINSAISHLNQVYRGQTANSPTDFGIQFSLAQQDPNCNASNLSLIHI